MRARSNRHAVDVRQLPRIDGGDTATTFRPADRWDAPKANRTGPSHWALGPGGRRADQIGLAPRHAVSPKQVLSVAALRARAGDAVVDLVGPRKMSLSRLFERVGHRVFDDVRKPTSYLEQRRVLEASGLDFIEMVDRLDGPTRQRLFDGQLSPTAFLARQAQIVAGWEYSPEPITHAELSRRLPEAQLLKASELGQVSAAEAVRMARERALHDVDVVIVGAGMAGLAAAQSLMRQGRSVVVLEAKARPGGRAFTDASTFRAPLDLGAAWLHDSSNNPLTEAAEKLGFTLVDDDHVDLAFDGKTDPRVAGRRFRRALQALEDRWTEVGESGFDVSAARVDPGDGKWSKSAATKLGPLSMGVEVEDVSTKDFARTAPEADEKLIAEGFGRVVETFAHGVPIRFDTPAQRIDWSDDGVEVTAGEQTYRGKMVLLTVSPGVLAKGSIEFEPELPAWKLEAAKQIRMGKCEKIVIEFDRDVFDDSPATAHVRTLADADENIEMMLRPFGTKTAVGFVAGTLADRVARGDDEAAVEMVLSRLEKIYGPKVRTANRRTRVTSWSDDPHTEGAWSAALPGRHHMRAELGKPIAGRLFFAGEACDDRWAQTVPGAMLTGQRAAKAMATRFEQRAA